MPEGSPNRDSSSFLFEDTEDRFEETENRFEHSENNDWSHADGYARTKNNLFYGEIINFNFMEEMPNGIQ